jgi:hypothetical protein
VGQIIEAIDECHRIGVKTVIISSIDIGDSQDKLYLYASSKCNVFIGKYSYAFF